MKANNLILLIFLMITISGNLLSNNDTYVTPEELEPGFGLYWTDNWFQTIPSPKNFLWYLKVSPDGRYLSYSDRFGLHVLDLIKQNKIDISRTGFIPFWSPDSKILCYKEIFNKGLYFFNMMNGETDNVVCYDTMSSCPYGFNWAPDGYNYFSYFINNESYFKKPYKINIVESRKEGYFFYEEVKQADTNALQLPFFPPNSMDYYINAWREYLDSNSLRFEVITDFKYKSRRKIYIYPPKSTWVRSICNTFNVYDSGEEQYPVEVGPNGDVYLFQSFRTKFELDQGCNPPFNKESIEARNACGWYRIDTSGNNLVQLVRSWTPTVGGLTITADGETIYYGFLNPDTTVCIMKMNKYGRNKKCVYLLDSGFISDVDENENIKSEGIIISPNPAGEYIEISFSNPRLKPWVEGVDAIKIFNLLGECVLTTPSLLDTPSEKGNIRIDVSGLAAGIYFVRCGEWTGRFLKMLY